MKLFNRPALWIVAVAVAGLTVGVVARDTWFGTIPRGARQVHAYTYLPFSADSRVREATTYELVGSTAKEIAISSASRNGFQVSSRDAGVVHMERGTATVSVYQGGLERMLMVECAGTPAPELDERKGVATIVVTDHMPAWRFYWIAFTRRR